MECEEARLSLYALLDDELDVVTNLEVLGHLEECSICQRELELDECLKIWVREGFLPPSPSSELWRKIAQRIDDEDKAQGFAWLGLGGAWPQLRVFRAALAGFAMLTVISLALLLTYSKEATSHLRDSLVQDHILSVTKKRGPADFPSTNLTAIAHHFREKFQVRFHVAVSQRLTLLGGSYCQIGDSKGIRLNYETDRGRPISFYQLEKSQSIAFPWRGSEVPPLGKLERPGIVLWQDDRLLYALVAELPSEELQKLASRVEGI